MLQEAKKLLDSCICDRRYLHAHAETGFDLHQTYAYIHKRLSEMQLSPQKCGRCGITCTLGRPGKTILLRADMDALPLREQSSLPYACTNGCMHACGHDMHAAMLLCAAQLLKNHASELCGTVKLMFQPAEEIFSGAKDMLEAGALEDPRVDAAMMLHVITGQSIPTGTVIVSAPGVGAPAAGTFSVHIRGRGTHGGMPHTGADPIIAAAHIISALQEIITHEVSPGDGAVLSIGMIQSGEAANVIPDTAMLRGNFRAYSDCAFDAMRRRIDEICRGVAALFRTEAEVRFDAACPTLINDAAMCASAAMHGAAVLGENGILRADDPAFSASGRASGSEDFAAVSHRVPSVMLALAAGRPEDGYVHPLHHPGVRFDEQALACGAAVYAGIALGWLQDAQTKRTDSPGTTKNGR